MISPRIRTGYSFRSSVGKIEDVLDRLKDLGSTVAPITDRASTFGFARWGKEAEKRGLRPIFGVELGVTDNPAAKKPTIDHWTFIAKDEVGVVNRLVSEATQQFRYEPLLTYAQAQAADVFKIAGHRAQLDAMRPETDDLYVGLGPACARGYVREATARGFRFASVFDNRYVNPDDRGFYEIICGRGANVQMYPQHIIEDNDWVEAVSGLVAFKEIEAAIANSHAIMAGSTAKLRRASIAKPDRPEPLLRLCERGADRLRCPIDAEPYKSRLEREIRLIAEKDFEDYFYIVWDLCRFAREKMIVGPARGSSCGSLVCYLLGITTIDPIPFGLIFERFIDVNRNDLPDIDIDFSDQQRHLVFAYLADRYGADRVARLGTVANYQPKSALSEAGAALLAPKYKCEAVAEALIERSSGDSRAGHSLEDTLRQTPPGRDLMADFPEMLVAARMEGHPRHYGVHAAGVVIASAPVLDYVAIDYRSGATMCDKKDAEAYDLLKIDALGLTQLSVFEDCLDLAGLHRDILLDIPLNDPAAFDVINKRQYSGIFQFNGISLQLLSKQFEVKYFDDLVSITALARPGPLASGGANEWVRRRTRAVPVTYPHAIFEPYLRDTFGVVLYQEQVMEIGRNIGDLDWGQVTALRKAMSKSLGAEYFNQFGDPWKKGAIAKGVDPKNADRIWDDLCAYGSWSFNKSHSVAYGLVSYQCCWLKAHYPVEFAAATLTHEKDVTRQLVVLRELVKEGFEYVPVDPAVSGLKWTVGVRNGKKILVGPLSNIVGIGPKAVQQILSARARGEPFPKGVAKRLQDPKTPIDSLWPIKDAIARVMPDPAARGFVTIPRAIETLFVQDRPYEVLVMGVFQKVDLRDENEAVLVAKRGKEMTGPTAFINCFIFDDTDSMFCKIDRFRFEEIGRPILERGRTGRAIYALKGNIRGNAQFRMMEVHRVRYIGDIESDGPYDPNGSVARGSEAVSVSAVVGADGGNDRIEQNLAAD